jgi:hypothetical protein
MLLRAFLNDTTSCASYLFGCGTQAKLAVVDPHAELVDDYLATAAALGAAGCYHGLVEHSRTAAQRTTPLRSSRRAVLGSAAFWRHCRTLAQLDVLALPATRVVRAVLARA